MDKLGIKAYLISLGISNAIWDIKRAENNIYAVDKNTQTIAFIPKELYENN